MFKSYLLSMGISNPVTRYLRLSVKIQVTVLVIRKSCVTSGKIFVGDNVMFFIEKVFIL